MNIDLFLLSLYSIIPPLRNEVKYLNFTHSKKDDGDYIWFATDGRVFLDLNLEKKHHDPIQFNLTRQHANPSRVYHIGADAPTRADALGCHRFAQKSIAKIAIGSKSIAEYEILRQGRYDVRTPHTKHGKLHIYGKITRDWC
jgi:hypothetical protein